MKAYLKQILNKTEILINALEIGSKQCPSVRPPFRIYRKKVLSNNFCSIFCYFLKFIYGLYTSMESSFNKDFKIYQIFTKVIKNS